MLVKMSRNNKKEPLQGTKSVYNITKRNQNKEAQKHCKFLKLKKLDSVPSEECSRNEYNTSENINQFYKQNYLAQKFEEQVYRLK